MIGEHFVGTTIDPLGPIFPAALAQNPLLRVDLRPLDPRLCLASR